MSEPTKPTSTTPSGTPHGDGELYGVLAEFSSPGALIAAAKKVRDAGFKDFDCYSPFPVHGIDEAMGIKRTILPALVFGGGLSGLGLGLLLQWWTNAHDWKWIVAGKPFFSIPANIPVAFETTILLSVFTAFFGMWILNKLPQVWHPLFRMSRFVHATDDSFFLGIAAKDAKFSMAETTALLEGAGALQVEPCYLDPRPESRQVPKWIFAVIACSVAFSLIPFALIAKARVSTSREPRYHVFSDMDFQPKVKSDSQFVLFSDTRGNRGAIPGTVARGSANLDEAYAYGLEASMAATGETQWLTGLPKQVQASATTLERGRNRFNVYCAPCHGYDGKGNGAVPQRAQALGGAWPARDLVAADSVVIKMPNGQLFNTISNGFNTMAGYKEQIPVADRWAIVLYTRALQRAANASLGDVPADQRSQLP